MLLKRVCHVPSALLHTLVCLHAWLALACHPDKAPRTPHLPACPCTCPNTRVRDDLLLSSALLCSRTRAEGQPAAQVAGAGAGVVRAQQQQQRQQPQYAAGHGIQSSRLDAGQLPQSRAPALGLVSPDPQQESQRPAAV